MKKVLLFTSIIRVCFGVDPKVVYDYLVGAHAEQIKATGLIQKVVVIELKPMLGEAPLFLVQIASNDVESGHGYNQGPRPGIRTNFIKDLVDTNMARPMGGCEVEIEIAA